MVKDSSVQSRVKLKKLLHKLGIKSAGVSTMQEMMENMMSITMQSFGRPNEIFMPGSALIALLENLGTKKE